MECDYCVHRTYIKDDIFPNGVEFCKCYNEPCDVSYEESCSGFEDDEEYKD